MFSFSKAEPSLGSALFQSLKPLVCKVCVCVGFWTWKVTPSKCSLIINMVIPSTSFNSPSTLASFQALCPNSKVQTRQTIWSPAKSSYLLRGYIHILENTINQNGLFGYKLLPTDLPDLWVPSRSHVPASYVSISERDSHDSLGSWRKDEDTFHSALSWRFRRTTTNNNNNKTWIKAKQIFKPEPSPLSCFKEL